MFVLEANGIRSKRMRARHGCFTWHVRRTLTHWLTHLSLAHSSPLSLTHSLDLSVSFCLSLSLSLSLFVSLCLSPTQRLPPESAAQATTISSSVAKFIIQEYSATKSRWPDAIKSASGNTNWWFWNLIASRFQIKNAWGITNWWFWNLIASRFQIKNAWG